MCKHEKTISVPTSTGVYMVQCNECHFYGTEDMFEELLKQEYLNNNMQDALATGN